MSSSSALSALGVGKDDEVEVEDVEDVNVEVDVDEVEELLQVELVDDQVEVELDFLVFEVEVEVLVHQVLVEVGVQILAVVGSCCLVLVVVCSESELNDQEP